LRVTYAVTASAYLLVALKYLERPSFSATFLREKLEVEFEFYYNIFLPKAG